MQKNKKGNVLRGKTPQSQHSCETAQLLQKSENYDHEFCNALAQWLVTFNEDSNGEQELEDILETHPYSKRNCEFMLGQLHYQIKVKLELFKLKIVTTKF